MINQNLLHDTLHTKWHLRSGESLSQTCWVNLYSSFSQIEEEAKLKIVCGRLNRRMNIESEQKLRKQSQKEGS